MEDFQIQINERLRKRGRPLTYEEKWIVQHVFEVLEKEKKEKTIIRIDDLYGQTSKYTGVGRGTVAKIVRTVRETGNVPPFTSAGNRMQPTLIPGSAEGRIREFVFEQHRQGAICSSKHVLAFLKNEVGLDVHERTLQRHLKRMGFWWKATKNKPRSLRENARIRQQRHDYLYELRKNHQLPLSERYQLVYLDESFLHHHHGARYSWFSDGDFIERTSGKGRRWCFIHAMKDDGLIDGALLIFEAKKARGDYHKQFDSQLFQHWFRKQLLPNLPPRCLIVLDRCPFHMVTKDGITPSQMKKVEIQKWLTDRGFNWEEQWLRARLIEEVDRYRDKKPMIEAFAEKEGHKVIFLPVHHPELNPIELVWATAKNYCGSVFSNDTSFKEQRQNLEKSFNNDITLEYCLRVYDHIHKIEEKYWKADIAIDDEFEIDEEEPLLF